jgi:hypothetical protein
MVEVIKLPVPASQDANEYARADTQRNQRLFDWADAVLARLGLRKAVADAKSIEELRSVTFNADSAEIILAIRNALHPASGHRQEHFRGLKEGGLKVILKNRFAELKKKREAALRRRKQPDWTKQLILDKDGKIVGNLANLILILREAPEWKGVLGYENSMRVSLSKLSKSPRHWKRQHPKHRGSIITSPKCEFGSCAKALVRRLAMLGAQCRQLPDTIRSTRCETISSHLFGTECPAWNLGSKGTSTSKIVNMFAQSGLDF